MRPGGKPDAHRDRLRLKVVQLNPGSGFFGGSMNGAVDKAADEIGNYAAANFH